MNIIQRVRPWVLPVSMIAGVVFHSIMEDLAFAAPYLIFVMLLITFCKMDFGQIRPGRMVWQLLFCQLVGSMVLYVALKPFDVNIAEGAFICVFCPTATAAPVITAMLGGSLMKLVSFSLISNVSVALVAPLLFTFMGRGEISFVDELGDIAVKVMPLLLLPLVTALALKRVMPRLHSALATRQGLSFYIWAVSLFIVVGRAVSFVLAEPDDMIITMVLLGVVSLCVCLAQFGIGRFIGRRHGDPISGAQGLGQKNTVLAIWMALTYLNPVSSVAPAAYVAWQNIINSMQLLYKTRRQSCAVAVERHSEP